MARKAKNKFEEWITEDGLKRIKGWARDGLTDLQISKNMGIAYSTFNAWKERFPEMSEALKVGKAPVDYEVENALLKSALGHTVKLRKPIKVKTEKQLAGKGKIVDEHIEYVEEEVYVPPQVLAQIFWLKNRKPKVWKDKQTVEADTTALEKLDAILRESRKAAESAGDDGLEYITEDEVLKETARVHKES